jgi:hypothetical protein
MYTEEMEKATTPWQDRVIPEPNSGCWLWEGATNGTGHGRIGWRRGGVSYFAYVHRLAWEQANGPVPDGISVLHRCDVRACCNPEHLFLGTQQDNVRDMHAKGRYKFGGPPAMNAGKTHCKRGHEFTPENTWPATRNGGRSCRMCEIAKQQRYRDAKLRQQ